MPPVTNLFPRRLEVLEYLAQGLSHGQIAKKMQLSCNTVRSHTLYLRHFFGVHSNVDAVAKARKWDLLEEAS
jgi:DNA-binding NarL/FixJ family response regulator